mgnify:CR=1 FL=1
MKANELRIGNYAIFGNNANSTTEEIVAINNTDWFGEGKKYWLETKNLEGELLNDFQPIPLTEEWLLKLGFERTYNSQFRLKYDLPCDFIGFDISKTEEKSMEGFRYFGHYIKIKYVHQLQNLYFALTGQELTINNQFINK